MLRWRLVLGVVFIAALVGLCWLDFRAPRPGLYLWPLATLLSLLAAGELVAMFRNRGHRPVAWTIYVGTLLAVLASGAPAFMSRFAGCSPFVGLGFMACGVAAGALLVALAEMRRYDGATQPTVEASLAVFAICYAGGLMGFIVALRLFGGGPLGMLALASLVATVKMSDIGQYTVGRLIGRHKLAPRISPGKTWEGACGGVLFAVLAAWAVFHWGGSAVAGTPADILSPGGNSPLAIILFAVAVAAAGMIGDLAESLLKRDAGIKDSSPWMPGFGGVLDLLDSLLVAAPVVYLFWTLGLVGP